MERLSHREQHGIDVNVELYFLVETAITLRYKKRRLLRCIHRFKSGLINSMDHMRISGNEPSSVILRQTKWFQKLIMLT